MLIWKAPTRVLTKHGNYGSLTVWKRKKPVWEDREHSSLGLLKVFEYILSFVRISLFEGRMGPISCVVTTELSTKRLRLDTTCAAGLPFPHNIVNKTLLRVLPCNQSKTCNRSSCLYIITAPDACMQPLIKTDFNKPGGSF